MLDLAMGICLNPPCAERLLLLRRPLLTQFNLEDVINTNYPKGTSVYRDIILVEDRGTSMQL